MAKGYFAYEQKGSGICILRCYGNSGIVVIPEELDGLAVTEVSSYAFAEKIEKEPVNTSGYPCICGDKLEEVYLPRTVCRLGRYIFYNCQKLRKLSFFSNLGYIGAGAFTGCENLAFLEMYQLEGRSCLREVLQDLKQKVRVDCYRALEGKGEYASKASDGGEAELFGRFVYPEFFEEAVENTPARIISTQTHGMGIQYRNAFRNTQIVFEEYDRLFTTGKYNMDFINIVDMAISRLRYPYSLEEESRAEYADWLWQHLREAAAVLLEQQEREDLRWLIETFVTDIGQIETILEEAKKQEDTEAISMMMDVKHRRFPARKKKFCL